MKPKRLAMPQQPMIGQTFTGYHSRAHIMSVSVCESHGAGGRFLPEEPLQSRHGARQNLFGPVVLDERPFIIASSSRRVLVSLNVHLNICPGHILTINTHTSQKTEFILTLKYFNTQFTDGFSITLTYQNNQFLLHFVSYKIPDTSRFDST